MIHKLLCASRGLLKVCAGSAAAWWVFCDWIRGPGGLGQIWMGVALLFDERITLGSEY